MATYPCEICETFSFNRQGECMVCKKVSDIIKKNEILYECLNKIKEAKTCKEVLGLSKYNNYSDAYNGVIEFARLGLRKADMINKEESHE